MEEGKVQGGKETEGIVGERERERGRGSGEYRESVRDGEKERECMEGTEKV